MPNKAKNSAKKTTQVHNDSEKSAGTTAIAAHYFTKFATRLPASFALTSRLRRPARDPINALLSLTYALGGQQLGRFLARKGFDVHIGYLHSHVSHRPGLMLDLLEPLRPICDDWLINFLKNNTLTSEDFAIEQNGCRLKKPASGVYFDAFFAENFLEKPLRREVAELLRLLKQLTPLTFLRNLQKSQADDESDDFN